MTLDLLLDNALAWTLQSLLLIALGAVLPKAFRIVHPATELLYGHLVLATAALLPFLQTWRVPVIRLDLVPPERAATSLPTGSVLPMESPAIDWRLVLLAVLAAGIVIRLLWLATGLCRLGRHARQARPLVTLPTPVREARRLTATGAEFVVSEAVRSPATFGIRRPAPAAQLGAATHELLHVRRRDWIVLLLEELYLALFWFHPLAWWLRSRMRLAREQLVDARSVQLTGAPKPYIEALIHSARHHHEPKARLAPGFGNRQQLGHRMRALLTEVPMSSTRLVLSCSAIVLALLVTLWAVLGLVPLTGRAELALVHTLAPRPPQDDASDGAVEVVVGHMSLLPGAEQRVIVELTYDPNGEVVDSRVLSGPEGLRQSALRIALGRRFTTSLLRLQIHVVFRGPVERENRPIPGTPPPTGGEPLRVGGSVMAGLLRYQVEPEWPPLAASAEITDDVILEATIGTGGAIEALRVLSGHNLLRDAAVDAVRYWRYAPYLLNGEAMRITTTVVVPFRTAP